MQIVMKKKIFLVLLIFSSLVFFGQTGTTNFGINSGTQGNYNSFFGLDTGPVTTGNENVFVGSYAGYNNTNGNHNIFIGKGSGYQNTTGHSNVLIGHESGNSVTTAYRNTIIGYKSGHKTTTRDNVFIGYYSGYSNTTGQESAFVGSNSGRSNTTGKYNAFFGNYSGFNNISGSQNVYIGHGAGYHNTSSNNNTYLGNYTGYRNITGNKNVFLGYSAGYYETGSNKLYIDNSNTSTPLLYGNFASDQLGINTNSIPTGYTFAVAGKIVAEEIKVQVASAWPDYVFHPAYKLPSLKEVEKHIKTKGQLTNIPSAKEVEENGIELGEMNAKLLQKIEELTLYILALNKRMEQLEKKAH